MEHLSSHGKKFNSIWHLSIFSLCRGNSNFRYNPKKVTEPLLEFLNSIIVHTRTDVQKHISSRII